MLNELALELGEDGIPRLAPDERTNALRLALVDKKTIIIFDNLETLHPDERDRLFQFLSRLPQGNKAIVTSRRRGNIDARVIRLDRMEQKEALQLINKLAENNTRLAREVEIARRNLYEISNGNPLLIKWVCGQLRREGSHLRTISEAYKYIEATPKGNDPLEYIFGDLLETFTENETKVLAALTHFTQPAKLKWLAQMTDLPERTAETALEDLSDRAILIASDEAREFFLPPLAAQFIRTRRPEAVTQTGDALTDRAYALAYEHGGYDNYDGFRTLDAEWDFLSAALPSLLMGDYERSQAMCYQLDMFLDFTGRWDNLLWLHEQDEARSLSANDKEEAGWRAYHAGWVYQLRNQPAQVLACAARAAEHWQDSTPRNKSYAIKLHGLGHQMNKNYPAAIDAFRESLEIRRSISAESDDIANVLNDLADAEQMNNDYSAAERDYREALRIAKKVNYQEGVAYITGNLANLALDREQWTEAESLAREALALAEKIGRQELIASGCHSIAIALLKQNLVLSDSEGSLEDALSLSSRAVEIFTNLRHPDLHSTQETLAEIEKKIKENRE